MHRLYRFVIFIAISFATFPLSAQTDNTHSVREARTVKYAAKDIVRVSTRPRFTTLILLPSQERILDFVIGDKDAWVLEGTQNFAYLKPTKAGLETSVNLITASGNIYTFYCVSDESPQNDLKVVVEPTDTKLLSAASGTPRILPASEVEQVREAAALEVKAAQDQTNRFRSDYAVHALKFDYKFKENKKPFNISAIYHDEIHIRKPNIVRLEARRQQGPKIPAVTIRDLLKASLRHRPERTILGEIRGEEAFDLLQALNTGHSGSLSTIHANSASQALSRLASCVLQSGIELPYKAIKANIAASIHLLIHIERRHAKRLVSEVLELTAYSPINDHFTFNPMYESLKPQEINA